MPQTSSKESVVRSASATQKYILMSPRKLRRAAAPLRGRSVLQAHSLLQCMSYVAAEVLRKKLVEAVNNAHIKYNVGPGQLKVSQVVVDEGPAYRRFRPRAQGRMYKRERPTAHVSVCVTVDETITL